MTKTRTRVIWIDGVRQDFDFSQLTSLGVRKSDKVIWVSPSNNCFETLSVFRSLTNQIIPIVKSESPDLLQTFRRVLSNVNSNKDNFNISRALAAQTIAQAIVRRISRESVHTAYEIDEAARFVLMAKRSCPSLRGLLTIICYHGELIDRPSLRIFYRLQNLQTGHDNISWIVLFKCVPNKIHKETNVSNLIDILKRSRSSIYQRIATDLAPKIMHVNRSSGGYFRFNSYFKKTIPSVEHAPEEIATYLVDQNYERALLTVHVALTHAKNVEEQAELYRLAGVTAANLGDYYSALWAFNRALKRTHKATLAAHLHYLIGLLYTKRYYDSTAALREYNRGVKCIINKSSTPEVNLEKSWLYNGIAFVRTLQANRLPEPDRTSLLQDTMRLEIEAFKLVARDPSPAHVYLRFNILANVAFLLEIMKDYKRAVEFWSKAFQPYLRSNAGPAFEKVFRYRLGLLHFKAGNEHEAINSLRIAMKSAQRENDRFIEERICYALGYVLLFLSKLEESLKIFTNGTKIAWELRDYDALQDHILGSVWSLAKSNKDDEALYLLNELLTIPRKASNKVILRQLEKVVWSKLHTDQNTTLAKLLIESKVGLRIPSPKLPPYLPGIDLEPTPQVDINRHLISISRVHNVRRKNLHLKS